MHQWILDLMASYAELIPSVWKDLVSSFVLLLQSSLLQGATLNAALNFIKVFVQAPIPEKPDFEVIALIASGVVDHCVV